MGHRAYFELSYQELNHLLNLEAGSAVTIIRVEDRPECRSFRIYFEDPSMSDVGEHGQLHGINWKEVLGVKASPIRATGGELL